MKNAFYNLVNFVNTTNVQDVYWTAAKRILQNIDRIPNSTIVDVADFCYVSIATISRLCRKLNYESFADFKLDVVMNLNYFDQDSERLHFDHQLPSKEYLYKGKEVFQNHFENVLDNLKATYESIKYEDIEYIVDKIHESNTICFVGNFFTQSVSMQLQIELSYLGKDCIAMYQLGQQIEIIKNLKENDLIIINSISGGFLDKNPNMMRLITQSKAYVIVISQLQQFSYCEQIDMLLKVGTDHHSLIGKFSITYIFEILEALYHLKYGTKKE